MADPYPFPKFRFKVTFMGAYPILLGGGMSKVISFSEVSGLKMGLNATENPNINYAVTRLPESRSMGNLTLKSGVVRGGL